MAGLSRVFFDTSVLVAGSIDLGEASTAALRLLDAVADGEVERPMTAWHCCLEFFSVTTRLPEEFRLSPPDALGFLQDEILPRFEVHDLPAGSRDPFLGSLVADAILGGRIYDAHIGEVARRADASSLVTDNRRHFTPLLRHGVRVLTSRELLAELSASLPQNS